MVCKPNPTKTVIFHIDRKQDLFIIMSSSLHLDARCSMTTSTRIRVVLADDHVMVRQGLASFLQSCPGIELVGEAGDGEAALVLVERLRPDVVILDVLMPKMDGVATAREIKSRSPKTTILGLSANPYGFHSIALLRAGALEVVAKEKSVEELYSSVERATAARLQADL